MGRNYYEILKVDITATDDEIKRSFRKLAVQYHPDKTRGDNEAEEIFKEINEAYQVLSDPQKRAEYDNIKTSSSFTSNHFNKRGSDVEVNLSVDFKMIKFGGRTTVSYNRKILCNTCNGTGDKDGRLSAPCKYCNGTGKITREVITPTGSIRKSIKCRDCNGSGKLLINPCEICEGKGIIDKEETIQIILDGSFSDKVKTIPEKGNTGGINTKYGDLIVNITTDILEGLSQEGEYLMQAISVPFHKLILGGDIEILTLDGPRSVDIPINNGMTYSIYDNLYKVYFIPSLPTLYNNDDRERLRGFINSLGSDTKWK